MSQQLFVNRDRDSLTARRRLGLRHTGDFMRAASVMIVADDADFVDSLSDLSSLHGYSPVVAATGAQAVDRASAPIYTMRP